VAAAQQLAALDPSLGPVSVAIAGHDLAGVAAELASADVDRVVTADAGALGIYTPDAFVQAIRQVVDQLAPSHVLFPHTYQTRDYVPTLAALMDRALVTDVIGIKAVDGTMAFARPMFQGKLTADVAPQGAAPHFVTIQIGAFRADQMKRGASPAAIAPFAVTVDPGGVRQTPEPPFQEAKAAVDLSQAERIVAVGRGIKSAEHLPVAEQLARAFGAELAASRPICDNGWLPMERQIGSSGQTVAPKLYVALGISGAIQHLVGMKGARTIVAINKDAEAPIFEIADYGIQGDLFEIVPALVAALDKG
jgi:electron transfer flavoprotein alpha subunit